WPDRRPVRSGDCLTTQRRTWWNSGAGGDPDVLFLFSKSQDGQDPIFRNDLARAGVVRRLYRLPPPSRAPVRFTSRPGPLCLGTGAALWTTGTSRLAGGRRGVFDTALRR